MEITAGMVKELRERSGAGMMECKKALTENGGNIDTAIEWLRKQGLAKADKKASRVAAEGRIALAQGTNGSGGNAVLVEINSETDFVANDDNFKSFADDVAKTALNSGAKDADALKTAKLASGATVEEGRAAAVAKLGENIQVRRLVRIDGSNRVGAYVHGGRIGVLVEMKGGSDDLARGVAMHVAAMNPPYISPDHVPTEIVEKEKEIALAQMNEKDRAKPADIQEKMVSGKIRKTLAEISLTGQPYVRDQNVSVGEALKKEGAEVLAFHRIAVGEGIEKVKEDYAAEVAKAMNV
jgi:elongation factor Ts